MNEFLNSASTLSLLLLLIFIFYKYLTRNHDFWTKRGIPGDKPSFLIGTLKPFWRKSLIQQTMEAYKKHGKIFGTFEGTTPVLVIADPELVKAVTVKEFPFFINRPDPSTTNKLIKKGIGALKDNSWKEARNCLVPAFTAGKLKQMIDLIYESVKLTMKSFRNNQEIEMNMNNLFFPITAQSIAMCVYGMKMDVFDHHDNEFVKNTDKLFKPSKFLNYLRVIFPAFTKYLDYFGDPFNYFVNLGKKTLKIRMESNLSGKKDFLQILLDSRKEQDSDNETNTKKKFTDDEIVAQAALFLFAGQEALANALAYVSFALALNEDVQEKLLKEVDEAKAESNGQLNYETIQKMKYLDMVFSETLRMYPPAAIMKRICNKDNLDGIDLPKGSTVAIFTYALHYDPEFFPDPEKFDPERFSPEEKKRRNPYAYIPFGSGPRNCIAMRFALIQMKVIMVHILSEFRFRTYEKTEIPVTIIDGSFGLTRMESANLKLEKRTDNDYSNKN